MDQTAQEDYKFSSVLDLHKTEDASILIASHESVVEFHTANMEARELCHDNLSGDPWTEEEREVARQKKKPLTEFNPLKSSERAFVGAMIQQRYDIKPAPRNPTNQNKADVFSAMYHWTADLVGTRHKDPNLVRSAWAGGNAWQESFVEITPGKKPRIHVSNENNFAIYPDPNRRDLIDNTDCEFIDRVSWMSRSQLADAIPEMEDEILAGLPDPFSITYEKTKVYADRSHEYENFRNGKYKVVERFYKVRMKTWFGVSPEGEKTTIGQDVNKEVRENFKENYPDHTMHSEREEFLFLAIVCPAIGAKFLFNDKYHCQPRDPATTRIMFPLVELVDEELDGQVSGHVFPQLSGIKLQNSLLTNKLFAAKNAAGQSHIASSDHFTDTVLEDIEENHNDGSRTFRKKPGAPAGSGMELIPQGKDAPENDYLLEFTAQYLLDVSGTPPSLKGLTEGAASGVLNEQRINQAAVQTQGFNNNYMGFLTRRAKLWKFYWKEYWKHEDVIRVLEKKDDKDPDWITINQIVADEYGNPKTQNSLDDADAYDITFEDSWKSPTMRDKVLKQLSDMMQGAAMKNDPEMASIVMSYSLMLSDAPQDFKNQIKAMQENKKKAAEAAAKAGPTPEPIRLSMSVDEKGLHDPNVILFLEGTKTINPQLAQQMLQSGPLPPETDPAASGEHQKALQENQALKLQAADKSREHAIKAAEVNQKGQENAQTFALKDRELKIKEGELAVKAADVHANKPPPVDPAIITAHIKAAAELEKAHIGAATEIHKTKLTLAHQPKEKPHA